MKRQKKIQFHPGANRKLVRYARDLRRELGTWQIMREMERRLGVNHRYISDNLTRGIEPPDTTPEGRIVRVKLFMKEYKPKPRKPKLLGPMTRAEWVRSIVKDLSKETSNSVIKRKPTARNYAAVTPPARSKMKKLLRGH